MEQVSLLCETENCGNTATVFGMKGSTKIRSCEEHIFSLIASNMQFFHISGYHFISNAQDAVIFGERKTLVEKGLENLEILNTICECELAAALQAIESAKKSVIKSVESRFEEMKASVAATCREAKSQLLKLEGDLKMFYNSKNTRLTSLGKRICLDLSATPRFVRFGIVDSSTPVSAVLTESWTVATADIYFALKCLDETEKKTAIEATITEAMNFAQKGISGALQYADSLFEGQMPFDEGIAKVLEKLLTYEKKRIKTEFKWLQRSWDQRQRYNLLDEETASVGRQLAITLYRQYGRFTDAEKILKQCNDIAQQKNPMSELAITLCNDLCGVYLASAQYQQLNEYGIWILETFGSGNLPAEHYWTTLFFLTHCYDQWEKPDRTRSILRNWEKRQLSETTTLAEMLKSLISGVKKKEAKKCLLQAVRIGISYYPTSPFTAFSISRLAMESEEKAREQYHRQAHSIYEIVAPKSIEAAKNMNNLGLLYCDMKSWGNAENCYVQALTICEVAAPKSVQVASILFNLGVLCDNWKRWEDAEQWYRQVQSFYGESKSISSAKNLTNLGVLYDNLNRWSEAEKCYRQAESIYEIATPESLEAAINQMNLGNLFAAWKRWDEAEECYRRAQFIFSAISPNLIEAAINKMNIGKMFDMMNQRKKAEKYYEQAQSIYEVVAPECIQAADNLFSLGGLCAERSKAEECYKRAQSIYEKVAPNSFELGRTLSTLGILYLSIGRWNEAEKCHKQAQHIYEITAPISIEAAINNMDLGNLHIRLGQLREAERCYQQSQVIYSEVAPMSLEAGVNICKLGVLFWEIKRYNETEKCYKQAQTIFEKVAPKSINAAQNQTNLGLLYQHLKRLREAEQCYQDAKSIYEIAHLDPIAAANNLFHLGNLYKTMKQWSEAESSYQQAQAIYDFVFPKSIVAANGKMNLGNMYFEMKRWSDAEKQYRQAQSMYKVAGPKSIDAAINLAALGQLYISIQRWKEAEKCSRQAHAIYEMVAPNSINAASNMTNLGLVCSNFMRWNESEQLYLQAQSIFEATAPRSVDAAANLFNMGFMYEATKQPATAVDCFERAAVIYKDNGDAVMTARAGEKLDALRARKA